MTQRITTAFVFLFVFCFTAISAQTYCEGWDEGYEMGYSQTYKDRKGTSPVYITPICPISRIGADTYQDGFSRGYSCGQDDFYEKYPEEITRNTRPYPIRKTEEGFCDGWRRGYKEGYQVANPQKSRNLSGIVTPICPIASIRQNHFEGGYNLGFHQGQEAYFEDHPKEQAFIQAAYPMEEADGDFCDGWESGYARGFNYLRALEGRMERIFITPICPIPKGGRDAFQDGFDRGFFRGRKDAGE